MESTACSLTSETPLLEQISFARHTVVCFRTADGVNGWGQQPDASSQVLRDIDAVIRGVVVTAFEVGLRSPRSPFSHLLQARRVRRSITHVLHSEHRKFLESARSHFVDKYFVWSFHVDHQSSSVGAQSFLSRKLPLMLVRSSFARNSGGTMGMYFRSRSLFKPP